MLQRQPMHGAWTRNVNHASIDIGVVIAGRCKRNDNFIKFKSLGKMCGRDGDATLERCTIGREQLYPQGLKFAMQKLRLMMCFCDDRKGMMRGTSECIDQSFKLFLFLIVVLELKDHRLRTGSFHRDQIRIAQNALRECRDR